MYFTIQAYTQWPQNHPGSGWGCLENVGGGDSAAGFVGFPPEQDGFGSRGAMLSPLHSKSATCSTCPHGTGSSQVSLLLTQTHQKCCESRALNVRNMSASGKKKIETIS